MEGSQNKKKWGCLSLQTTLADNFFHRTLVPVHTYQRTRFQRSISISFRDK